MIYIDSDRPFIQVAGVRNNSEACMLIDCGVKYLGFPLRLTFHKEDIPDYEAAAIINKFPSDVHAVLITYLSRACDIISLCDYIGAGIVQIHGRIALGEIMLLRRIRPDINIIKSLIVRGQNIEELLNEMHLYSPHVDCFITDTYDEVTGASGATGKMHDLKISSLIVERSNKNIILAGGLNPENVYDAILQVKPQGVDVHTGVENSKGWKDKKKVDKYIRNTFKAFEEIHLTQKDIL